MERKVIVAHGLGDGSRLVEGLYQKWWRSRYNQALEFHQMPWEDETKDFSPKLNRLINRVDEITERGNRISLIGLSGGGSAVLNTFCERKGEIDNVVNVCGRLREGLGAWPPLSKYKENHSAFVESVLMFEENEKSLSFDERKRILTVRPFVDEVVPVSTMILDGAMNTRIISVEHMMSIIMAMTVHSERIYRFIEG